MSTTERPQRKRLPPDERRRQLVAIGLQELSNRPIQALSIDHIAELAGISRGLLFRYFPTKHDYYVAVVAAAARRLLRAAVPDEDDDSGDQLRAIVAAFVSFVDRHGVNYQEFFHGGFGSDPQIREIHEHLKDTMAERAVVALGVESTPLTLLRLRGWWSMVESLAVDRLAVPEIGVADVLEDAVRFCPVRRG
ncbi:TetR/AcrR family transcriptional regulator [Tomitella biformata]|uniref:TetR/AcrR family transcriptional regulator n=1 Tax=Tomitella biformata TaxID=630403 RepID=UPI001F3A42BA|nr:TetR/AcrR family transcriptional regulator [Tomitella biformata]